MTRKQGRIVLGAAILAIFAVLGVATVMLVNMAAPPRIPLVSTVGDFKTAQRLQRAAALIGPAPETLTFEQPNATRQMTPDEARLANAKVPLAMVPRPPADSLSTRNASLQDWSRSRDCMTAAVYYESNGQPSAGQRAVAQVVLNRLRHPAFPPTVCGVVFEKSERSTGCQFTFTCDGSLNRVPDPAGWARARSIADAALAGYVEPSVSWATHYHADYVVPYWAASLTKLAVLGSHIFYRWNGTWGQRQAFRQAYRGGEPAIKWNWPISAAGPAMPPVETLPAPADAPLGTPLTKTRPMLPWANASSQADGSARPVISLENRKVLGEPDEAPEPLPQTKVQPH